MSTKKNLGIWMDHSCANLIDLKVHANNQTIESEFTFETKEEALQKGEKHMHTKEQQMHEAYYNEIGAKILNYDNVLLFGPTNAKVELHNQLNGNQQFKNIHFEVVPADNMTDNQKEAFVKAHFA